MRSNADYSERLQIFFGDASDAVCRIYARLPGMDTSGDVRLRGSLSGPMCQYAETLQTSYRLTDRGPGASLLAEAIVPEPCFWTPEMPHLYRGHVELVRGEDILAQTDRIFGIRRLGVRGRSLIYDGKRWVLRGVRRETESTAPLEEWREAESTMIVRSPEEGLCEAASRTGVLVVAVLEEITEPELRRLSRWPAVGIVVGTRSSVADPASFAPNLLLAQWFSAQEPLNPQAWASLAVLDADAIDEATRSIASCTLPVVAMRASERRPGLTKGRAACDRLQCDLAGRCEPAGYIV